jgi:YD repeat-containing protein
VERRFWIVPMQLSNRQQLAVLLGPPTSCPGLTPGISCSTQCRPLHALLDIVFLGWNKTNLDYRMTALSDTGNTPIQSLSYGYNAANNVLAITDAVTPGNSQSFGYDLLDRLTSASGGYGALAYTYWMNCWTRFSLAERPQSKRRGSGQKLEWTPYKARRSAIRFSFRGLIQFSQSFSQLDHPLAKISSLLDCNRRVPAVPPVSSPAPL